MSSDWESTPTWPIDGLNLQPDKNTQRAHTSLAKAAHYPHIAWIPDLENQHGDPDHPQI